MAGCYCIALRSASRRLTALYDEALTPVGVNIAQFGLLRTIRRVGPVSLTELARLCALDRSTVGRNAKVLQRMALIRGGGARDQREAMMTLTETGMEVLEHGAPLWEHAQHQVETALGSKDAARLLALIMAL